MSFSFDKVRTGTYNFVSFIWNSNLVGGLFATVMSARTQFFVQVKIISTSQLINGIFKLLQKLLKYFKGITISAFVNESLFCGVFPTIRVSYLKDSELVESGSFDSSL